MTFRLQSTGYSLLELTFVVGLMSTVSAIALPQMLTGLDDSRAVGAARYMSTRFQRARMEAVMRSADVALRFTQNGSRYSYAVYLDGNGNGVLARDIQRGLDRLIAPPEQLSDHFTGVDFGTIPGLPAVDPGGAPPGADPIRLGAGSFATFSAAGTATPGSVYIRGRADAQYVDRIYGTTGKTRVLKFDRRARKWRPL